MCGVVMETTARKRAELLLREKAQLASLNAELALALSRTGDLRQMLQECVEVLGHNVSVLMPEDKAADHDRYIAGYLAGGQPRIFGRGRQVMARRRDGSTFPAHLAVSEFMIDGKPHFTGVVRDFNNLLTVISGPADLMAAEPMDPGEQAQSLAAIRKASRRAAALTRQLPAFSRQAVLQLSVLDLNALVEQAARMLGRLIGEDITLTTVPEADLAPVEIDAGQFEPVLMNLAINARDAMPLYGRLDSSRDPGAVAGGAVDTGPRERGELVHFLEIAADFQVIRPVVILGRDADPRPNIPNASLSPGLDNPHDASLPRRNDPNRPTTRPRIPDRPRQVKERADDQGPRQARLPE